MAIGEAIAGAVEGLFNGGINLYNSQRDFDYQKRVQQEVWNREDTAVQRRMEDLKAAGLNPNLAAGSAAGAGAVVGRSNTPGVNMNAVGSALDAALHKRQIEAQEEQNRILKNQEKESQYSAYLKFLNAQMETAELSKQLGLTAFIDTSDGTPRVKLKPNEIKNLKDTYFSEMFDYALSANKNSADMLQKDNEFYVGDKIAEYLGSGLRAYANFGSGYWSFNRKK